MINTHILALAAALPDADLLARLDALAGREREATVELIAHLAALEARPSAFAARGYGSLFAYCTGALHLSEDAACNRIEAAKACRRFPEILDRLGSGGLSLTTVRMLARHLTPENHENVLARAEGLSVRKVEVLIAELAPRPDVPASVRKLPMPTQRETLVPSTMSARPADAATSPTEAAAGVLDPIADPPAINAPMAPSAAPRPLTRPLAPERYRVQFTIGEEAHEKLRRLQCLLRREIPSGDAGAIFERGLSLLLERVERDKLGARQRDPESPIRRATDYRRAASTTSSRYIPRAVKWAVWVRDGGRCAFVSADGHRCTEENFLEFHHIHPHALRGPATVENISLRCRLHNRYEAELVFAHPAGPAKWLGRPAVTDPGTPVVAAGSLGAPIPAPPHSA
jgi:hypothetical protein